MFEAEEARAQVLRGGIHLACSKNREGSVWQEFRKCGENGVAEDVTEALWLLEQWKALGQEN